MNDAAAIVRVDGAIVEPALADKIDISFVGHPTPPARLVFWRGEIDMWGQAIMYDEKTAFVDEIERRHEITITVRVIMEAIDQDDVKAQLVATHPGKASIDIQPFASKIDIETIIEISWTAIHEAMRARQSCPFQFLVEIAGRRGTELQVARQAVSLSQETDDLHLRERRTSWSGLHLWDVS